MISNLGLLTIAFFAIVIDYGFVEPTKDKKRFSEQSEKNSYPKNQEKAEDFVKYLKMHCTKKHQ